MRCEDQGNGMEDDLLPERQISPSGRKWLIGLWIVSTVIGTTAWWAGIAWAAIRLAEAMP